MTVVKDCEKDWRREAEAAASRTKQFSDDGVDAITYSTAMAVSGARLRLVGMDIVTCRAAMDVSKARLWDLRGRARRWEVVEGGWVGPHTKACYAAMRAQAGMQSIAFNAVLWAC